MGIVSVNPREAEKLVQQVSPHVASLKRGVPSARGVQIAETVISPLSSMFKLLPDNRRTHIEQFASRQLEKHTPFSRSSFANKGFLQALRLGRLTWSGEEPHPGFYPVFGKVARKILKDFAAHHGIKLPR
ncbi:hypothetical protein HY571_01370 [Candidatus Micrarchaeota archaeon]|nr:hypothetical protein [Candidatus Micrarchaeota archaeon]